VRRSQIPHDDGFVAGLADDIGARVPVQTVSGRKV
jgi:hypothetical protein